MLRAAFLALLSTSLLAAPPKYAKRQDPAAPLASQWLRGMTLSEKAAQLLIVPVYGDNPHPRSKAWRELRSAVVDLKVGGVILLNRVRLGVVQKAEPYQAAVLFNRLQKLSKLPLIVGGDFERGASMRLNGTPQYPHLMAYGAANDLDATRTLGRATAREARALGVHWVYAPDADVNNNPDNPIINIRSFGEDPKLVATHVKAFIEGARSDAASQVLLTVKHFPGHGDTNTDSHIGLGVVSASQERMEAVEFVPFRAAIAAGVDSIMTAHLAVPAFESETLPATVSRNIMTGVLRDTLGFKGLITTDAMDMQGLAAQFSAGEAAVRAIEAGVDVLLVPADPRAAVRAIVAAVQSRRITPARLDDSVRKVLAAKVRLGLHRSRFVSLDALAETIASPEDGDSAESVAARALTLVRNENSLLPLDRNLPACHFVLSGSRFSAQGRDLAEALRQASKQSRVALLDPNLPEQEFTAHAEATSSCPSIAVFTFVVSAAYQGSIGLPGRYPAFMEALLATGKPLALVSLGNPYLIRAFPGVKAYLAAFSTSAPSEAAVVKALYGEAPITGRLPVSIPEIAPLGFGLDLRPKPLQ
jgi:beta-N-acetylhexosaminidase